MKIAGAVRSDIIRYLRLAQILLPEGEDALTLWDELFDLGNKPSTDSRFKNAYADAWQHTVNNYDWDSGWILSDDRINLIAVSDEKFAGFLEAVVNSDVQEPERQGQTVERLNKVLEARGLLLTKGRSLAEFAEYRLIEKDSNEVNNQGRAHSSNLAGLEFDGLRFRSRFEIALYREMKSSEYVFAPLPVFISPRRIEPDFVILHRGKVFVVEVDGQHMHTETPVTAQQRVQNLERHGAYIIRVLAEGQPSAEWAKRIWSEIQRTITERLDLR